MAVSVVAGLAASAAAPVYAVVGENGLVAAEDLSLNPAISIQSTPRHAGVLLVCGSIRADDHPMLRRLHDQLPHPRATLWWQTRQSSGFPGAEITDADPAVAIRSVWQRLVSGEQTSEHDLLPNEPPTPWRGKGDHGQGGKGMMGGMPYGRPMAMGDKDCRDGLALDAYSACFGPFSSMLPPGLKLELTLQGDLIQSAKLRASPFAQGGAADAPLRRIARLLRQIGMTALAARFFQAARSGTGELRILGRTLRWSGALRCIPPGLGTIAGSDVRSRLCQWWEQAQGIDSHVPVEIDGRLVDLMPGLEWSEAIILANSFELGTLRRLCPLDPESSGEEYES